MRSPCCLYVCESRLLTFECLNQSLLNFFSGLLVNGISRSVYTTTFNNNTPEDDPAKGSKYVAFTNCENKNECCHNSVYFVLLLLKVVVIYHRFMKLGMYIMANWSHLNGVLHKSFPSVCVSVFVCLLSLLGNSSVNTFQQQRIHATIE
jgi:hypothetical protein